MRLGTALLLLAGGLGVSGLIYAVTGGLFVFFVLPLLIALLFFAPRR